MKTNRVDQGGFGLLEVLVSVMIFSVGGLALARVIAANQGFNRTNEERSGAIFAAGQVLDELRLAQPRTLLAAGADPLREVTVGPRTYQVYVEYCADDTLCVSESIRAIHVEAKLNGKIRYQVDTVFAELK